MSLLADLKVDGIASLFLILDRVREWMTIVHKTWYRNVMFLYVNDTWKSWENPTDISHWIKCTYICMVNNFALTYLN